MARWQELYELIQDGLSAAEIMKRLAVPPSRLRQMLAGRRLARMLKR